MKKYVRMIACVLMLALVCTSFCGCYALDELRSNHAMYKDNDTILWNGEEYKRLPACEAFCPSCDYSETIYVTDSDVPTLLSGVFGHMTYVCADGAVLQCDDTSFAEFNLSGDYFYPESSYAYYCLAKDYDRIKAEIEQAHAGTLEYNTYSYSFGEYDETIEWYETRTRILTQTEKNAFLTAVGTASPAGEGAYDWQMEFIADVSETTEDLLLFGYNTYGVYRFMASTVGTLYFIWDNTTEEYYAIDPSYTAAFDTMFDPAIKAMEESEWTEDGYELDF